MKDDKPRTGGMVHRTMSTPYINLKSDTLNSVKNFINQDINNSNKSKKNNGKNNY